MTVQRALKTLNVSNPLVAVKNGEEALEYLEGLHKREELPCIILLDLNMPRMNGLEFLEKRRKLPSIQSIPVVVLTTSVEAHDKTQSYELGIAGYMRKPVEYKEFVEVMRTIKMYWTLSEPVHS